jgi:glycosyltransferase involved in cell wall biosynthesis
MNKPIAAVVTPVFNGGEWIQDTVLSILDQSAVRSGRVDLRYVVMDGGSTDDTIAKVDEISDQRVTVVSATDNGMYDALAKGFRLVAEGSTVCAYLNAGDLWHEKALDIVLDVMAIPGVHWVCGYQVAYNKRGDIIHLRLPFRFRSRLIQTGSYLDFLPPIQQESTFWRTSLLESVDLNRLAEFRLAGDYYLWHCFSRVALLRTINSVLGGFRLHGGHLSDARQQYRAELATIIRRPSLVDRATRSLDRVIWRLPDRAKKGLSGGQILRYDLADERWR